MIKLYIFPVSGIVDGNVAPVFVPSPSQRRLFGFDDTQSIVASQIINPNITLNCENKKITGMRNRIALLMTCYHLTFCV